MFVNNSITEEDSVYIKKFLDKVHVQPLRENPAYVDEIKFIKAVQHAVLQCVPHGGPLPYGNSREPKDIYDAITNGQKGACCDKSRLIEKILRRHGFKTRHIFMYSKNSFGKKLLSRLWKSLSFFHPHAKNHAVSEVLTKEGWLVVDSNAKWVSLDKQNHPYSMRIIPCNRRILWEKPMCKDMKEICEGAFSFLYGLYSRCGRLYPPFIFCFPKHDIKFCFPFPDINCCEFLYNFSNLKKIKGSRDKKELSL